jgi:signal peptidase II
VRRSAFGLALVSGAIVALDQWAKHWATRTLVDRPPVEVIGSLVRFTYTRNAGVAFGLGAGFPFPYYLFSIAAVLVIVWLFARQRVHGGWRRLALALILGGAIGNLIDRIASGEVVDFILLSWRRWQFPVFNVADSAVTIGVVLFALTWPRRAETPAVAAPPLDDPNPEPVRSGAEYGGAAGPLPGRGTDGPLA